MMGMYYSSSIDVVAGIGIPLGLLLILFMLWGLKTSKRQMQEELG